MKRSQLITRSALTTLALLNVSLAAVAEPVLVTRGPNGAAHLVNAKHLPREAQIQPNSDPHPFPNLIQKGPGGAFHLGTERANLSPPPLTSGSRPQRLITRGPNGAGFLTHP
ncbi:hypothetical protein [Lyngbya confervoides]|uniref:Uncharacterized protein n=1 Tax=Lyngbya confervoides BDU141951 TaxID=1574623 RepID=A0ABD4T1L1_9CYAN|nr:hypothetical protein [Lyngbya confervoides]MCM1982373.1 hypothetical protein [Lyngbya confervoides BDU141951]